MRISANLGTCRAFGLAAVLLSHLCFCQAQPHCLNESCGGISHISYPFGLSNSHVQGYSNGRCGHPGFQIHCDSGIPHLTINGGSYRIVGQPSYDQNKITIVNDAVFTNPVCSALDAPVNLSASPFSFSTSYQIETFQIGCNNLGTFLCNKSTVDQLPFLGNCVSVTLPMTVSPIVWAFTPDKLIEEIQKGFDILWNKADEAFERCRTCTEQKGFCGFNDTNHFVCYRSLTNDSDPELADRPKSTTGPTDRTGKSLTGFIMGACVGSALLIICAVILALRRRKKDFKPESFNSGIDKDMELGPRLLGKKGSVRVFTYQELEQATDSFDTKRELGDGGFASVYLGKLCDGRLVAVKKLFHGNCKRVEQFDNEVRILSQLNHPNLVLLIGYCHYRSELLLVYEYASNGTLADHIHGESKGKDLKWQTRLNITFETAQALSYLHFCVKPPIFHRDVKSSNILLDENFSAKVADFGLSRLVPAEATHISTGPQGTPGYLDPDYHLYYRLTDKSDVYSFGVVLAELISAKKAVDITRERKEVGLANLVLSKIQCGALHELVDPNLEVEKNPEIKEMVWKVAELAFRCLAPEKDDRPNMMEVAAQLQQIKEFGYGGNSGKQPRTVNSSDSEQESKKLLSHVYIGSPTSVQQIWSSTSTTPDSGAGG